MEQEFDKILEEYEEGNMNLITLNAKLLHLFSVVRRSEQLVCPYCGSDDNKDDVAAAKICNNCGRRWAN